MPVAATTELDPETGHLILTLAGDEGTVCVAAWYQPRRRPAGVLVAHSPRPLGRGHRPHRRCELCGRTCYILVGEKDGRAIALLLLSGKHEEAEREALRCYQVYLCPEPAAAK